MGTGRLARARSALSNPVLHGRVNEQQRREELQTQVQTLQAWAASQRNGMETLVLRDIGSGLNAPRRQLPRLLTLAQQHQEGEIAITSPDRLKRIGQEQLDTRFESGRVTLTVLVQPDQAEDGLSAQELIAGLLTLIASVSGRLYAIRSHQHPELLQGVLAVLTNPSSP
jgi:putative resolvase